MIGVYILLAGIAIGAGLTFSVQATWRVISRPVYPQPQVPLPLAMARVVRKGGTRS